MYDVAGKRVGGLEGSVGGLKKGEGKGDIFTHIPCSVKKKLAFAASKDHLVLKK